MQKHIYGIQGGKGSFNEQAVLDYLYRNQISDYEIKYLYTSERVLKELTEGLVNYGQFAVHNSAGGMVLESLHAMAKYSFEIVELFGIEITHHLMKRKDVEVSNIKTIMAHPQVLAQCKNNLLKKYPNLNLISGEGDLIDTAKAAEALSKNEVDKNTYILGPRILSEIYDFEVVDSNLQDLEKNITSFLLVK